MGILSAQLWHEHFFSRLDLAPIHGPADVWADLRIAGFIGEAKLVADLVHENIVQVYALGLAGDVAAVPLLIRATISFRRASGWMNDGFDSMCASRRSA